MDSRVLLALVLVVGLNAAFGALTVTDPAFSVSSVIPGWVSAPIAFTSDGTLWAIDQSNGCLYKFPNVAGNPTPATTPIKASDSCLSGYSWDWGIVATSSDRLFTASGLEITAMKSGGSSVQAFGAGVLAGDVRGITVDPVNGDLVIAGNPSGRVYRVQNPETHSTPTVVDISQNYPRSGLEGLAVGPDGTVYAGDLQGANIFVLASNGTLLEKINSGTSQAAYGPTGFAVAADNSYLVTSRGQASLITKWTLPGFQQTTIATTNGYNAFTTVGPDGCMYITSITGPDGILRVSGNDGKCHLQNPNADSSCDVVPGYSLTGSYAHTVNSSGKSACFQPCN